jgi:hypothetical protein
VFKQRGGDNMYVIVMKQKNTQKVISGVLQTKSGAEALLKIYNSQVKGDESYYIKEAIKK